MLSRPPLAKRAYALSLGKIDLPPEIAVDLEAENTLLRAALAKSEGAGVRRELVSRELQHRISNLLAVVMAIARQSFKPADAASLEAFSLRLLALSTAQKLLIDSETRAASMAEVVAESLAPHGLEDDRVAISGPEVALDGRRAHALTLALHELATNAIKYGALSVESGWVEIVWSNEDGRFEMIWQEHEGPPVAQPTRKGFGSILVSRNLGVAFGGEVTLDFQPSGFTCRLSAPAA